jgi:hypothetical protein
VAQRVEGADFVAIFTDYVKHDVQEILRSLRCKIVFAEGGPSRLVRQVVASVPPVK